MPLTSKLDALCAAYANPAPSRYAWRMGSGFPYGSPKQNEKAPRMRCFRFGDPYGNRTHVFAVRGRCLNRLTNGPCLSSRSSISQGGHVVKCFFWIFSRMFAFFCFCVAKWEENRTRSAPFGGGKYPYVCHRGKGNGQKAPLSVQITQKSQKMFIHYCIRQKLVI